MRFAVIALAASLAAAPIALAQTAPAPIKTKSGEVGAAPADKGQIVFFRPGSIFGAALGCTVREGEGDAKKQVARLGSGKYFVVTATPGKHQYYTEGEAKDRLNLEIEPGETYFVKCNIGMGVVAGRANLSPSDRATFEKKAKGLKLWSGGDKDDKDAPDDKAKPAS
ncbi:hypothetical protein [Sphingomonas sp.]|uniref:hypothetical protein n=1 Tax=Sphingomonas sp. TaxID=28214 RepID=UPI001D314CA9|nr:hypothetical protein [Sphingomonas sp.]MBX9795739.1 DUF2846 domain-containing protein [Sphingomonas sp.]